MSLRNLYAAILLLFCLLTTGAAAGATLPAAAEPALTRLEQVYSDRAGQPLRLFGYDLFQRGTDSGTPVFGMVQDSYPLGVGDRLRVTLQGRPGESRTYPVGSDGTVIPDGTAPVLAAGRTLGEVRIDLIAAVTAAQGEGQGVPVHVSLAEARRITVLVVGAVARPGRVELSAFSTVFDALQSAGGIDRSGSLRAIRLVPASGGPAVAVDLYDLLSTGRGAADRRLEDGARLVVPPLGGTVAIAGQVQRPGIYELPGDEPPAADAMTDNALLALAGGPLLPGSARATVLRIERDGVERAEPLQTDNGRGTSALSPGDIVLYGRDRNDREDTILLAGAVHQAGARPLLQDDLASTLQEADLTDEAYRGFAVLDQRDPVTGLRRPQAVDLNAILRKGQSVPARAGDRLIILDADSVRYLSSEAVLGRLAGKTLAPDRDCPALAVLDQRLTADPRGPLAAGPLADAARQIRGPVLDCPELFRQFPAQLPFALEHAVLLRAGAGQPGLYPLAPGSGPDDVIVAAGGRRTDPSGLLSGSSAGRRDDGIIDRPPPAVELLGSVRQPGVRPLDQTSSLRHLLQDGALLTPDSYTLLGVILRADPAGGGRAWIPFVPARIASGSSDRLLRSGDRVIILSRHQMDALVAAAADDAGTAAADGSGGKDPKPAVSPQQNDHPNPDTPPAVGGRPPESLGGLPADLPVDLPVDELATLIRDRVVQLRGAVLTPGPYPVGEPVLLALLLSAAGGPALTADLSRVEIVARAGSTELPGSHPEAAERLIGPGDGVRVPWLGRPAEPRAVYLSGEVRHPGPYDLKDGESLSSLIDRAGGLTPQSYTLGAVFTRVSARRAEAEGFRRFSIELERGMAVALLRADPPTTDRVALVRDLADRLRSQQGSGRITVQADPAVLRSDPTLDILLEAGDRVHFPRRPLTVTVAGEVLSPASLQFVSGKSLSQYLDEAGGLTRFADPDLIFVIRPDGSAQPVRSTRQRHRLLAIPPGSTIVVPRDPEPFEFLPTAQSVATILGQLALTAASIASITDD
jgi:polysaccharide biosynthesis/export protein